MAQNGWLVTFIVSLFGSVSLGVLIPMSILRARVAYVEGQIFRMILSGCSALLLILPFFLMCRVMLGSLEVLVSGVM